MAKSRVARQAKQFIIPTGSAVSPVEEVRRSRTGLPVGKERGLSSDLSPAARRILDAARGLLHDRGYRSLTFDAIAAESGMNKSMIRYYFGSKDGLVAALLDDLTHDNAVGFLEVARASQTADESLTAHVEASRQLVEDPYFKNLFDILPEALRRPHLRASVASLYEWYREIESYCLGQTAPTDDPDLRALASLYIAVIDGLALQLAVSEKDVDLDRCWGLIESMIRAHLSVRTS
ncbi:MAG: TetR/AcrR family transcriptional regulator [Actinomycetia bacterium]|nr:TetR/AcrR family transcriptional regulator [Actinomycetes bacterium]